MLFSTTVLFSSCGILNIFKKKIDSGTEAAKLLLANERFDENLLSEKIDVGFNSAVKTAKADTVVTQSTLQAPKRRGIVPLGVTERDTSNPRYTWSGFAQNYSMSVMEFSQFMKSVEHEAGYVSEDIAEMKQNVGVVDKWVKTLSGEKQMLRVFENADVLLSVDSDESVHVYYRYTDENAKNVYEMYSLMNYDGGHTGKIRTLLIPGERCEYFFEHSDGFKDYFIAENSRGYWLSCRFNYNDLDESDSINFFTYAVKDNLGFGCTSTLFENPELMGQPGSKSYTIFDPTNNRDFFSVSENESFYSFGLSTSAIQSGLNSITGNVTHYDDVEGIYFSNEITSINTSVGDIFTSDQVEDDIFCFDPFSDIRYDYAEKVYYANLIFSKHNPKNSIEDASLELLDYLDEIGIKTYCDPDSLVSSLTHASALHDAFSEIFEWNGYTQNSVANLKLARDVLLSQYSDARNEYEQVKDWETVSSRQMLSNKAHFASIDIASMGSNVFDGSTINISGISAYSSDTDLFEKGTQYVLKIGLSLIDENGNPVSVNTVPLAGGNDQGTAFGRDSITLSQNGTFSVPKNLDSGEYALVAYMATKDEGIRVSEMKKIGFVEIYEGEIESSAMHIESINQGGALIIKYEIKNSRTVEIEATKESYTYAEIKRMAMIEILAHGAPYSGAELEYENGETVQKDTALGVGTYRMMCYLATSDGLAQSYVYLNLN